MAEPAADQALLIRLRNGDERAASEVVDLYADRLVRLASRRISQRLASRIGAEDIVQSVFRTFFHRARQGEFELHDREDMTRLLARITLRKTFRQVAHHLRDKRSVAREAVADDDSQKFLLGLLAREPAPEEAVALLDEMETLLAGLKDDDRRIVELKLQGYTSLEIADQLGVSDRKVRRLMERLRSLAAGDPLALEPPGR
jgi:RNA polymerase sigma-70 factor, ECF subfamily